MPAKVKELEKVAQKLGFEKVRQKGSHARWQHPDGRATTIPIHGNTEIGGWLLSQILKQMGITEPEFNHLRK
ncbi:YcfA family protein [Planktothrix agardhii]|jgi:predicted RNA binding protein YcfA (HicA-like mRNA interferase family)|uniref:type II toxin-antitoxin system HicA family toxin n=1 Tax=Planktothrix agardhii TaxID=1160 RepID=UPI0020A6EAC0|nr:type II toxin-antitoxin system HicA family toxin [Planktothrix agardhii]CAD5930128.1 YcfA family protein [Planktothrix agardhii]CAD5931972.1 YcfA family protein [Planktothrix agardhii]